MPYSSYRPHNTDKDEWQNNSIDYRVSRRNALFEQLRSDSYEIRAQALAQLLSNLESWVPLAYSKTTLSGGAGRDEEGTGSLHRQDSLNDGCVFPLDNDEEVHSGRSSVHTLEQDSALKSTSSLSLPMDIDLPEPEQPPVSMSPNGFTDNGMYADYSMYGPEVRSESPKIDKANLKEALNIYLALVLRASIDCPFADVRRKCRFILHRVSKLSAPVPSPIWNSPSWLIPLKETIAYGHERKSERPDSFSIANHSAKNSLTRTHALRSSSFLSEESESSQFDGAVDSPDIQSAQSPATAVFPTATNEKSQSSSSIDSQVFESVDSIPISNRVASKRQTHAPNASDIDKVLLGPVGGRRARFSIDIASPSSLTRPALDRKRMASQEDFGKQRRASPSLRQLHISCYQASGRITNLGRILSYFPRFYETTIMLHDELIRKTGTPLQRVTRLYLCLMAAAETKSQYHISYYTYKYLQLGEHIEWLEGLDKAPRRVQKLATINSILAHQPWKMTKAHIQDLLGRSKDATHTSDQWTMGELCQAMCILTVVHSQARFVLGCGVVPEPDTIGGAWVKKAIKSRSAMHYNEQTDGLSLVPLFMTSPRSYASGTPPTPMMALPAIMGSNHRTSAASEEESIPSLLRKRRLSVGGQRLDDRDEAQTGNRPKTSFKENRSFSSRDDFVRCGIDDLVDESMLSTSAPSRRMPGIWAHSNDDISPSNNEVRSPTADHRNFMDMDGEAAKLPVNPILEKMSRYCRPEDDVSDKAFDIHQDTYSILDLSEFNWEDHCCALIGRIVPGLEVILEQTLTEAQEAAGEMDEGFLFSDSYGPVDQRPLREAVWNFVLRLYGVHQEGYRYQDVHLLLNKSARRFIKKVCFHAESISRHDWATVGKELTDQEKVLLTLLASHARLSASLLYAFRYCD